MNHLTQSRSEAAQASLPVVVAQASSLQRAASPSAGRDACATPTGWKPALLLRGLLLVLAVVAEAAVDVSEDRLWPAGVVPFAWDPQMSFANRLRVVEAMNIWTAVAHMSFVLRNGEADYVLIQNAPGDTGSRSVTIGRGGGSGTAGTFAMSGTLGRSEGAVRVNVCRLRKEFRAALFATIADTLDEPTEESIRAEVRALIDALGA